ncbi:MAG: ABC transporter permease [Chloroflexaceae bacterium]|nr:ABC transporter permease [Chloroflexaceae bacterium]
MATEQSQPDPRPLAWPVPRLTRERLIQIALVVLVLLIWEIVGRNVGAFFLAPPSASVASVNEMIESGDLPTALQESLYGLAVGFAIALLIALVLGTLMGWFSAFGETINPYISAIYVVPIAALVPLLVLWFGIGMTPRIITIVLFSVFEMTIATATAIREVDQRLIEMARTFGGKPTQIFRKVVFDALPVIFTGVRIGIGRAVQGMITAEVLFAVTGLGGLIITYASVYRLDKMFVIIVLIALIGVLLAESVRLIEYWLTPWKRHSNP